MLIVAFFLKSYAKVHFFCEMTKSNKVKNDKLTLFTLIFLTYINKIPYR